MKTIKPLNELTLEELCVHMADCQEYIENNAARKTGKLYLYCDKCGSPYSIITQMDYAPVCDNCCMSSRINIKESELPLSIDRHMIGLCRMLVRAAEHLNEDAARIYLYKIYDYVCGQDVWYDEELYMDNPINWYPHDFVHNYTDPEDKLDRNEMMNMLYEQVIDMIHARDELLHKVNIRDIQEYQNLGVEIPYSIECHAIKQ